MQPASAAASASAASRPAQGILQAWDLAAQLGPKQAFALRLLKELGNGAATGHASLELPASGQQELLPLHDGLVAWLDSLQGNTAALHAVRLAVLATARVALHARSENSCLPRTSRSIPCWHHQMADLHRVHTALSWFGIHQPACGT